MYRRTATLTLILLTLGCSRTGGESAVSEAGVPAVEEVSAPRLAAQRVPEPAARAVAREAAIELQLREVDAGARRLRSLAESMDGYVVQANAYTRNEQLFYHLTIRIPAARLSEFLEASRSLAIRVISEQESAEDVTEQLLDVGIRIQNLTAAEDEMRRLLAESRERKSKVSEIMEILEELTKTRTQIERLEAQKKNLDQRVEMATVTLKLTPEPLHGPIVDESWRPLEVLSGALRTLRLALQAGFEVVVYLIFVVVPILGLVLLAAWALLRLILRLRGREKTAGI